MAGPVCGGCRSPTVPNGVPGLYLFNVRRASGHLPATRPNTQRLPNGGRQGGLRGKRSAAGIPVRQFVFEVVIIARLDEGCLKWFWSAAVWYDGRRLRQPATSRGLTF